MVRPRAELASLRFSRLEKERLLLALLFSLLAHLGIWGGYEAGKKTGLWERLHWPVRHRAPAVVPQPVVQAVDPTIFVDVSQASADAPKEAKYYSDKNSRASNPDADKISNQPKLTGKQREVPKTEDTPRPIKAKPSPPTPPEKPKPVETKPAETKPIEVKPVMTKPAETKPATALNPGTLQPGKPAQIDTPETPTPPPVEPKRPRTLREARQASQIPGLQMQQEGGVARRNLSASFDVKATPFGAYDSAIIAAIRQRWYDLLDSQQFAMDRTGKVTIYFHLNADGSATECKIVNNTVGDVLGYLCLESIEQSAPFAKWPSDMRLKFGPFREITFTFIYY